MLNQNLYAVVLSIQVGLKLTYTKQNVRKIFCKEYIKNQTNTNKILSMLFLRWGGEGHNSLFKSLHILWKAKVMIQK